MVENQGNAAFLGGLGLGVVLATAISCLMAKRYLEVLVQEAKRENGFRKPARKRSTSRWFYEWDWVGKWSVMGHWELKSWFCVGYCDTMICGLWSVSELVREVLISGGLSVCHVYIFDCCMACECVRMRFN